MTSPKRHHFLPITYQNGFLSDDGFIWVYEKGAGEPREQKPKNTGVISNYYKVTMPDGAQDSSLETDILSPIDSLWKPLYDKLHSADPRLNQEEKDAFLLFMTFMYLRTPRTRKANNELALKSGILVIKDSAQSPEMLKKTYEVLRHQGKIPEEYTMEDMKEMIMNVDKDFKVTFNDDIVLECLLKLFPVIFTLLKNMYAVFVCSGKSQHFITSDNPVVPFVRFPDGQALFGAGFGDENVEISFPISPTICAFFFHHKRNPPSLEETNHRTAFCSDKEIYSFCFEKWIVELATEYEYTKSMAKVDDEELKKMLVEQGALKNTQK